MSFGYTGSMLRFDLTNNTFNTEIIAPEVLTKWIGGTGLGVKYVYDEVGPSINWDDPENRFVVATGPLAGTSVTGSGNFSVVTKGPMTGGISATQANGYFAAFLKFCGYDALIIEGQSSEWVYIYIDEDKVEIRPAAHLVGLDTVQTQDVLHQEFKLSPTQLSVFCIGPAGENLVKFACLVGDYGHVAAHNGVGAVLGAKKIKAIAVRRGKKKVKVFNPEALRETATKMNNAAKKTPAGKMCYEGGTNTAHPIMHNIGGLPVKNLTTNIFPEHQDFSSQALRTNFEYKKKPCWGCDWNHCGRIKIKSGPFEGFETEEPEYEAMVAFGSLIGLTDPASSMVLADLADRLGMDVNETGWLVAWVMECYEKGYLKDNNLNGLKMTWGNFQSVKLLLEKISRRQGFGSLLAEGVKRAAKEIGGPALECAVYTEKGNTPRSHDHRALWTEFLDTCVSNTGTIECVGGGIDVSQHKLEPISDPFSWEQIAKQNAHLNGRRVYEDSLGVCRLTATEDINLTVSALKEATGIDFTPESVLKAGKRIVNLMRVFNLKNGLTAEHDWPSPRYASTPVDGPALGRSVGMIFAPMKERYYELMGWDKKTGQPLPETLRALDLADVI
ncbi:MAG: aldehyde ferredoxin oxidoreductase family protein, partial [Clostridia bacterium]|nr:aldehyde ferredoxin oxidoreductase family protein [Clostridia bacterium]